MTTQLHNSNDDNIFYIDSTFTEKFSNFKEILIKNKDKSLIIKNNESLSNILNHNNPIQYFNFLEKELSMNFCYGYGVLILRAMYLKKTKPDTFDYLLDHFTKHQDKVYLYLLINIIYSNKSPNSYFNKDLHKNLNESHIIKIINIVANNSSSLDQSLSYLNNHNLVDAKNHFQSNIEKIKLSQIYSNITLNDNNHKPTFKI